LAGDIAGHPKMASTSFKEWPVTAAICGTLAPAIARRTNQENSNFAREEAGASVRFLTGG
jgi:hypothetical protein